MAPSLLGLFQKLFIDMGIVGTGKLQSLGCVFYHYYFLEDKVLKMNVLTERTTCRLRGIKESRKRQGRVGKMGR